MSSVSVIVADDANSEDNSEEGGKHLPIYTNIKAPGGEAWKIELRRMLAFIRVIRTALCLLLVCALLAATADSAHGLRGSQISTRISLEVKILWRA
jgi:hypothetical protein